MNRFWSKVRTGDTNECWEWTAAAHRRGYGVFQFRGKMIFAHRFAYCLDRGLDLDEIEGQCICHSCDNPVCVNPSHLWLGTVQDNNQDRDDKGRGSIGEQHGNAKLDEDDVLFIRAWLKSGYYQAEIAETFEVSQPHISDINTGKKWSHISKTGLEVKEITA